MTSISPVTCRPALPTSSAWAGNWKRSAATAAGFPCTCPSDRVDGTEPPQFVGFIRDITAETQARRSTERLMNVSRLATMGEMAAGIAHEINQPLTAIATYARAGERFLTRPEPVLEETREALREIAAEALRAGEIIRRLRQTGTRRRGRPGTSDRERSHRGPSPADAGRCPGSRHPPDDSSCRTMLPRSLYIGCKSRRRCST